MKGLLSRVVRLFADDAWLAGGTLLCVLARVAMARLGGPPSLAGWLLPPALATILVVSICNALTKR